jgi:hypothetical protein
MEKAPLLFVVADREVPSTVTVKPDQAWSVVEFMTVPVTVAVALLLFAVAPVLPPPPPPPQPAMAIGNTSRAVKIRNLRTRFMDRVPFARNHRSSRAVLGVCETDCGSGDVSGETGIFACWFHVDCGASDMFEETGPLIMPQSGGVADIMSR